MTCFICNTINCPVGYFINCLPNGSCIKNKNNFEFIITKNLTDIMLDIYYKSILMVSIRKSGQIKNYFSEETYSIFRNSYLIFDSLMAVSYSSHDFMSSHNIVKLDGF